MASCGFAHFSGGPCGSSADNPANVQCVVVGSCAKSTQGHLRNFMYLNLATLR